MDELMDNDNIRKLHYIVDTNNSNYRNGINYLRKLKHLIEGIDQCYDMYMLIRSDMIFVDCSFIDLINTDDLYVCGKQYNTYIDATANQVNTNVLVTRSWDTLQKLRNIDLREDNHSEIILYDCCIRNRIPPVPITIDYKLMLSLCNIISIAGDSGSGKSTLAKSLNFLFKNSLTLETDRYHKWERGDVNYKTYTHLNPYANHLVKMENDVYNLKIGNEIYTVDYDHETGKFTAEEPIAPSNNIIVCGLHTLYNNSMNQIVNLKIYMDTDRELIKKWKIQRDTTARGYSYEDVVKQLNRREKDYNEYILSQKNNADMIVRFYEADSKIECKLTIINPQLILRLMVLNMKEYTMYYDNMQLLIKLRGQPPSDTEFSHDHYGEIQYIICSILRD